MVDDSRDRDSDRGREREREGGMDMGMKGYMVKNCLENVQSTLIHRNKDNLALMKQLLVLS